MKTTIVPAQITTVEDRIAGNFTFTQLGLLTAPLLTGTVVYAFIAPKLQIDGLKLVLIVAGFALLCPLAIRINGKILAAWLVVYVRFALRPRIYTHTKTDLAGRDMGLVAIERPAEAPSPEAKTRRVRRPQSVDELIRANKLLGDPSLTVSFELTQNGGIDVSLAPVKH